MRVKAGLTETKRKSRSNTATASLMLRSTSLGDAALALGAAAGGDVARGAGHAQRRGPCRRVRPRGRARAPRPTCRRSRGRGARTGTAALRRAGGGAAVRDRVRQVVRVDLQVRIDQRLHPQVRGQAGLVVGARAAQHAACQVVVPELFARCPQRELEAFVAFADLREVAALAAAVAGGGATPGRRPARAAPARAAAITSGCRHIGGATYTGNLQRAVRSRRRRGWWPARGRCSGLAAGACR